MPGFTYSEVDAQLLIEVRVALLQGRLLPISILRVLAARGWVHLPVEIVCVRAVLEDDPEETLEEFSQALAVPCLTWAGREEIALHRRIFADDFVEDLIAEDEEMDEWGEDDADDDWLT